MAKINESEKSYSDCAPEQCFWARDGQILKNVAELPAALEQMSAETFAHHANKEKNDFANWIEHVFNDKKLAQDVRSRKYQIAISRVVRKAL